MVRIAAATSRVGISGQRREREEGAIMRLVLYPPLGRLTLMLACEQRRLGDAQAPDHRERGYGHPQHDMDPQRRLERENDRPRDGDQQSDDAQGQKRSEEHTSELPSLMRHSYAVSL